MYTISGTNDQTTNEHLDTGRLLFDIGPNLSKFHCIFVKETISIYGNIGKVKIVVGLNLRSPKRMNKKLNQVLVTAEWTAQLL